MKGSMWNSLSGPWQTTLDLAWDAYCKDCIPIGAVVTDENGIILSQGRNRVNDITGATGHTNYHFLANAELNALITLDYQTIDPHTCVIYTTTEPCPLCMGAIYMSGLRSIHYASRDPFAGSTNMLGKTPYLSLKPVKSYGPFDAILEVVLMALYVEFAKNDLQNKPSRRIAQVLERMGQVVPECVQLGNVLHRSGELRRMQRQGFTAAEVINTLATYVKSKRYA